MQLLAAAALRVALDAEECTCRRYFLIGWKGTTLYEAAQLGLAFAAANLTGLDAEGTAKESQLTKCVLIVG